MPEQRKPVWDARTQKTIDDLDAMIALLRDINAVLHSDDLDEIERYANGGNAG